MKNLFLVERSQKKLRCGATVTRFRETVFEEEPQNEGAYFKDKLWDEEN